MIPQEKTTQQTLLRVQWTTPTQFYFWIDRPEAFVFQPGQFARIGLSANASHQADVWRPYSIISGPEESHLAFLGVLIAGGAFSACFAKAAVGDPIWLDRTVYGFFTGDRFTPANSLWLIATGTGIGPFLSMLYDPRVWQTYAHIVVVHRVNAIAELAHAEPLRAWESAQRHPGRAQLHYMPLAHPEDPLEELQTPSAEWIPIRTLETVPGVALDPDTSRIMLCGHPAMIAQLRESLKPRGFATGRRGAPGNLAAESYW